MRFLIIMGDLLFSLLVGIFVATKFYNYFLDLVASALFVVFLPGIMVVVTLGGGRENTSEVHMVLGVALQLMIMLWLIRKLIKGIRNC